MREILNIIAKIFKTGTKTSSCSPCGKRFKWQWKAPSNTTTTSSWLKLRCHESLEFKFFFIQSGEPVSAQAGHQKNRAGNEMKRGSTAVPAELGTDGSDHSTAQSLKNDSAKKFSKEHCSKAHCRTIQLRKVWKKFRKNSVARPIAGPFSCAKCDRRFRKNTSGPFSCSTCDRIWNEKADHQPLL